MKALIGSTGFVGSNLLRQQNFSHLFHSTNIEEMKGGVYEEVVCAGAPAAMWIANSKPEEDRASINRLLESLAKVEAKHVTLISTIAVFKEAVGVDEESIINPTELLPYGRHRLLVEEFIADHFSSYTILRLPALFGQGLKKNAIFDLLNDNQVDKIDSRATYQFYNLEHLSRDAARARELGIKLLHLATEPTSMGEIAKNCFGRILDQTPSDKPSYLDFRSLFAQSWSSGGDGYLYRKQQIFDELRAFVASYSFDKKVA